MSYPRFSKIILPVRLNIQDNSYDCGPASLIIILASLNRPLLTESELIKITQAKPGIGTSHFHLLSALNRFKIKHNVIKKAGLRDIESSLQSLSLCLVNFQAWAQSGHQSKNFKSGHYSVIFGYDEDKFFFADPGKSRSAQNRGGFRSINKKNFKKRWFGLGSPSNPTIESWLVTIPLCQ